MDGFFFDFEALEVREKAEEEAAAANTAMAAAVAQAEVTVEAAAAEAEFDDDGISEVWPDDLPNDLQSLEMHISSSKFLYTITCDAVQPWEVVFSRVVARAAPNLAAPVVSIHSRAELLFGDPHWYSESWIRLGEAGSYVLKDGRLKDPKLGVLLKPFDWPTEVSVPESYHCQVLSILRDLWVQARRRSRILNPADIRRLRLASDEALQSCSSGIGVQPSISPCLGHEGSIESKDDGCQGGDSIKELDTEKPKEEGRENEDGELDLEKGTAWVGTFDVHKFENVLWDEAQNILGAFEKNSHDNMVESTVEEDDIEDNIVGDSTEVAKTLVNLTTPFMGSAPQGEQWDHLGNCLERQPGGGVGITPAIARRLVSSMRHQRLPSLLDLNELVEQVRRTCVDMPSLTRITVPLGTTLHVIGDVHGQYWDLMHIFDTHGEPSPTNMYLFNGDLVDRGQQSVEVVVAVFSWFLACPGAVFVNRGNHEAEWMNMLFGFQAEATKKYSEESFTLFSEAFRSLPLASVINDSVFVVHGGLSDRIGVKLEEIEALERRVEPRDGDSLMVDLLWSDPMECHGSRASPRGGGVLFGPDITRDFCGTNDLLCVIRSHEMRPPGYEWGHNGLCLTLFSAANYCGICANLGAVCNIRPAGRGRLQMSDLQIETFETHDPFP
mmetsp:Transcript_30068/g.64945  ORF Transcript_30068/g.64945 Transcript_30068/m.64945 type:complete len:667 (+) Transcript_30068:322-2322(+)